MERGGEDFLENRKLHDSMWLQDHTVASLLRPLELLSTDEGANSMVGATQVRCPAGTHLMVATRAFEPRPKAAL